LDGNGELTTRFTLAISDLQKDEQMNENSREKKESYEKMFLERWSVYK